MQVTSTDHVEKNGGVVWAVWLTVMPIFDFFHICDSLSLLRCMLLILTPEKHNFRSADNEC